MKEDIRRRAAQGDPQAFGEVCRSSRAALLRLAERIVGNHDVAEDLLQEGLLEAFVNIARLKSSDAVLPWIRGVIKNRCYNHLRRAKTARLSLSQLDHQTMPTESPLDRVESSERRDHVHRAVGTLSGKNRCVTELYYLSEKSIQEVSHILGISRSATRVRLSRSRKLLRELLAHQYMTAYSREENSMAHAETEMACSFCGASVADLGLLITGPGVNICSLCVEACLHVMIQKHGYAVRFAATPSEEVTGRVSADL